MRVAAAVAAILAAAVSVVPPAPGRAAGPQRPEPTVVAPKPPPELTPVDRDRLTKFLTDRFGGKPVRLEPKPRRPERADVYVDDIYLGEIEAEIDDGRPSWTLTMPIEAFDLDEAP
jgi:hypothetical protein